MTSGKRIEHLELYGMTVTDKGIKALSRLDSLLELHICDLTVDNESSWLIIGDCVNLTQIRFTDGEVTDAFLRRIGGLRYLSRLELDACSVSAKGLSYLVNSKITYLSLKVTPLTAKHVDEIVKLKRLLCLFLGDTGITDSDVMRFTELPYLVTLGINGAPVTDSTLLSLHKLAYLRVVYGFRCENLTPAGIERFKNQNRKVQFVNDENDVSRAFVPH
ncbi:MAG: hypothetical protein K2X93_17435 [Candidatus Obscuribacterales bacterium]|nr:hypothetical protein [Candidatus Obscuribacterales bacterium]